MTGTELSPGESVSGSWSYGPPLTGQLAMFVAHVRSSTGWPVLPDECRPRRTHPNRVVVKGSLRYVTMEKGPQGRYFLALSDSAVCPLS